MLCCVLHLSNFYKISCALDHAHTLCRTPYGVRELIYLRVKRPIRLAPCHDRYKKSSLTYSYKSWGRTLGRTLGRATKWFATSTMQIVCFWSKSSISRMMAVHIHDVMRLGMQWSSEALQLGMMSPFLIPTLTRVIQSACSTLLFSNDIYTSTLFIGDLHTAPWIKPTRWEYEAKLRDPYVITACWLLRALWCYHNIWDMLTCTIPNQLHWILAWLTSLSDSQWIRCYRDDPDQFVLNSQLACILHLQTMQNLLHFSRGDPCDKRQNADIFKVYCTINARQANCMSIDTLLVCWTQEIWAGEHFSRRAK